MHLKKKIAAKLGQPYATAGGWAAGPALKANALAVLGAIFLLSIAAHYFMRDVLGSGASAVALSAALLFAIFAFTLPGLRDHPHKRFGLANGITALRAAITSIVAATVFLAENLNSEEAAIWTLTALVLGALALDGVDGFFARRLQQASAFGARFDMEVDAFLILILSIAGFALGKAGLWILLIGLMRYAFVLAQYFVPRLKGDLPASFRRKLVCVVQVAALCVVLTPIITPPYSNIIALLALASLTYSFAVDTIWLLRK